MKHSSYSKAVLHLWLCPSFGVCVLLNSAYPPEVDLLSCCFHFSSLNSVIKSDDCRWSPYTFAVAFICHPVVFQP